jgi:SAM-dependent MidA family methyltransferase
VPSSPQRLPAPDADALAVSRRLIEVIVDEIDNAGGALPFDRYMELALYRPGLGYYANGSQKFGAAGDFVTAPQLGDFFGRCLARSIGEVVRSRTDSRVLELGAGSGVMAVDILRELAALDALPARYLILDRSGELRARQQARFEADVPQFLDRIHWLDELPAEPFDGVVLGNEVVDAFPVKRFRYTGTGVEELGVGHEGVALREAALPAADARLAQAVMPLAADCGWPAGYESEWCPGVESWVASFADVLRNGVLLLVDYGYGRAEYYHPQRVTGTLMCHYRHRAHADPFLYPGLQDMTAYVDFTRVAEAAAAAGMRVSGFSTQAFFLLDAGLQALLEAADPGDPKTFMRRVAEVKTLTLPGEMGERFKAIACVKGEVADLPGFRSQDLRGRL